MQTPHLPKALFGDDFNKVYEPAEDTFLLLDALEQDLHLLRRDVDICLECGSGSGTVITALSIALEQNHELGNRSRLMFATDINPYACQTTRKCADYHKRVDNIQVVQTNLAESIIDRLEHSVDLLVFNPPYVPTEIDETVEGAEQLKHSWSGGTNGRALIDQFLQFHVPRLLTKVKGVAYMVALSENNIRELCDILVAKHNIVGKVVLQRRAGAELLHVIKYQWMV